MDLDVRKITMGVVAMIVAILVVITCATPIMQSLVNEQKTIFNNDYNRYSKLIDSDLDNANITIVWPDLTQGSIEITIGDNDPYTLSVSRSRVPLVLTEFGSVEENAVNSRAIFRSSTAGASSYLTGGPITITVSSGVVTVVNGTGDSATTNTFNVGSWLFYPDDNGDYTAMNTTSSADDIITINSIDDLYFATTINTDNLGFVSGHGATCTFYNVEGTPSYSMELLDSEEVSGYNDVITTKITNYAISAEAGTNLDNSQFVPFITMVPRSVEGHTNMDNTLSMMISIIPLLMVIAIVIGAIGMFIKTRRN